MQSMLRGVCRTLTVLLPSIFTKNIYKDRVHINFLQCFEAQTIARL